MTKDIHTMSFYNAKESNMDFFCVVEKMKKLIMDNPCDNFIIAIGSDSQVIRQETVFITGIVLRRQSKGCWGCVSKNVKNGKMTSLRKKILTEIYYTRELLDYFMDKALEDIYELILPFIYKGANISFEVHLDIGENGETRKLINEMIAYFADMEIKIKPEAYTASGFANKFSKKTS